MVGMEGVNYSYIFLLEALGFESTLAVGRVMSALC